MPESSRSTEERGAEPAKPYPLQVDNRFSLMGYTTAFVILLIATAWELDELTYASVFWYGAFGMTFHASLEIAGHKHWVSKRVHSVAYELIGMLVWIASFAYAATLLDNLRPLLLVGSFLALNFAISRGQTALATRLTGAVSVIYLFPAMVAWVLGQDYAFVYRDLVFVVGFVAVATHGILVARHFGVKDPFRVE